MLYAISKEKLEKTCNEWIGENKSLENVDIKVLKKKDSDFYAFIFYDLGDE